MKKALRVVSSSEAQPEEESSAVPVCADVILVADSGNGDMALAWALELLRSLVELGSKVAVAVHTQTDEAQHRGALERRFRGEGASAVRLDARLAPLAEFLSANRKGSVSLLVGGVALRCVEGGVRIVLRTPRAGVAGMKAAEELEDAADLVLGSKRDAFAKYYARHVLGID